MFCDFNIMSIEWQTIFDFIQKQINDLKYFFDVTINIAIEIIFVEQTKNIERMIHEIINVCFDFVFVFVFAFFVFSQLISWNSIIYEQKQFVIESIFVFEHFFFQFYQNDFAKYISSIATILFNSSIRFMIVSFFRVSFRSILKFAFHAFANIATFIFSFFRWFQSLIYWRVAFLYRYLIKKKFD